MHNLSCENEFYLHENEKWFPYQRLSTYPRFETKARGNSEMAYSNDIRIEPGLPERPTQRIVLCIINKVFMFRGKDRWIKDSERRVDSREFWELIKEKQIKDW